MRVSIPYNNKIIAYDHYCYRQRHVKKINLLPSICNGPGTWGALIIWSIIHMAPSFNLQKIKRKKEEKKLFPSFQLVTLGRNQADYFVLFSSTSPWNAICHWFLTFPKKFLFESSISYLPEIEFVKISNSCIG